MLFCVEVLKYLQKCCTMNVIQAKMATTKRTISLTGKAGIYINIR